MELRAIRLTTTVPVEPSALYAAWLDSDAHSAFTGAPALIDPREGGKYQAWGDYIQGTVVALHEGASVVQTWRASEFPADAVDSLVEVTFAADGKGGTLLTLVHTGLPADLASQYEHGWDEYYFKPMRAYFRLQRDRAVANKRLAASLAAAKKAVVKKPAAKKPAAKKPAAKKPAAKKPAAKKPAAKKPAAKKPAAKKPAAKKPAAKKPAAKKTGAKP